MPALAASLILACAGGGTAIKPDSAEVYGTQSGSYDYGRGQYSGTVNGTVTGTRTQDYADQVDVELVSGEGRIRLPRTTLPVLRGGEAGWFELRNIEVTDRAITATAAVNFLNKPRVHIDRVTGTITIHGKNGDFTGRCRKVEPEAEQQF